MRQIELTQDRRIKINSKQEDFEITTESTMKTRDIDTRNLVIEGRNKYEGSMYHIFEDRLSGMVRVDVSLIEELPNKEPYMKMDLNNKQVPIDLYRFLYKTFA